MTARALHVARRIRIARPPAEVFALVAEPANDPRWCAKVRSVEQVLGAGPGPGARYLVVHVPVPLRPPRRMDHRCVGWEPPHRITWREDDGTDVIEVEYRLTPDDGGTLFEQRDEAHLGAPGLLRPVLRAGLAHDLGRQLRALRRLLEAPDGVGRA
jgi:uncharacterized protein YndB with AHSA1/START domain